MTAGPTKDCVGVVQRASHVFVSDTVWSLVFQAVVSWGILLEVKGLGFALQVCRSNGSSIRKSWI